MRAGLPRFVNGRFPWPNDAGERRMEARRLSPIERLNGWDRQGGNPLVSVAGWNSRLEGKLEREVVI